MVDTNKKGLWLTSFQMGPAAERPTTYPGAGNLAVFFATDTGVLSVAPFVANEGAATWVEFVNAGDVPVIQGGTIILADIPTSDPSVAGALWSDSGVVTVSAGA